MKTIVWHWLPWPCYWSQFFPPMEPHTLLCSLSPRFQNCFCFQDWTYFSGTHKKSRKTSKNTHFDQNWPNLSFFKVFLDFFRNHYLLRASVFCVAFSASRRFFLVIKIIFFENFNNFYLKKGGGWGWGVKF